MASSAKRDSDISKLHPAIRDKVTAIQKQLNKEGIDFHVFEAFRTPERQAILRAKRPKVTWVGPWGSIHQYGLAVDFVLKIKGKWSWDDQGAEAKHWDRMHELAKENGMTPLYNNDGKLVEKPHIQLMYISATSLRQGVYPKGGDEVWAERLGELVDNWEGPGAAPPKPELVPERPPLDADLLAGMDVADAPFGASDANADECFQKLHSFIKLWEGGFVDHPEDKGGATNMGITIGTLAQWRDADVTVADVRDLTRAEADAIFRARYYSLCRCGEMPERMAAVVYNCAVLSGPARSVTLAQRAFNSLGLSVDGNKLAEDGVLGRITMGAIQQTDAGVLASAFMDQQENYLRGLDTFHVFGPGWMNRMAALREFVNELKQGAGFRPTNQMTVSDQKYDIDSVLAAILSGREKGTKHSLSTLVGEVLDTDASDGSGTTHKKALLKLLLAKPTSDDVMSGDVVTVTRGPDGKPPLTPINAALGQTVGRALNGKKSVTGVVGLLLTVLLPRLGLSGDIVEIASTNSATLVTLFTLLTGWGMFGKLDKAIRLVGMINGAK